MLADQKILVTGPAGQIGLPLVEFLARDNEVWGLARFATADSRQQVEAVGVTTRSCDLARSDFRDVPDDFTYVVHLAAAMGGADYDDAIRVNAEGTGLLLQHCRRAKAALVMSTHSVYRPHDDPLHVFRESDPLGDVNAQFAPAYSVSKIGQESVARFCARAFDLPVVIARMNASYGANGGLPAYHIDAILDGRPVPTRWDPCTYSPIHQDDINEQAADLLGAAAVPATVVNWAGDDAVSVQQWCTHIGRLAGVPAEVVVTEVPGTLRGSIADTAKRASITGPCRVGWRVGLARTLDSRHPDRRPTSSDP